MDFICGKNGSGKSYISNGLDQLGIKKCVSYTTRNKRENEIEGVDYYFISEEEFINMINNKDIIDYKFFNNAYYGISNEELLSSHIIVASNINNPFIKKAINETIYIDASIEKRFERMQRRNSQSIDETFKRLHSENFDYLFDRDMVVFDNNLDDKSKILSLYNMIANNEYGKYKIDFLYFLKNEIVKYKNNFSSRKDIQFLCFEEYFIRSLFVSHELNSETYNEGIIRYLRNNNFDYKEEENVILLNMNGSIQRVKKL